MQGLHTARSPEEAAPRSSLLNSCDKHSDRVNTGWVPQGPYLIPALRGKGESQVPAEPSSGSLCILKMAILYLIMIN